MTPSDILPSIQDTTVVAFAPEGLSAFAAWVLGGALLGFVALVAAVLLVLVELKRLSAAWTDFLATTSSRSESLVASAASAARNIDHITGTVRGEVDRLQASVGGMAGGLEEASAKLQRRLKDLLALVDLAQSEAEEAVLDAAARVRALRAGAGGALLGQLRRTLVGGGGAEGGGTGGGGARDEDRGDGDGGPAGDGAGAAGAEADGQGRAGTAEAPEAGQGEEPGAELEAEPGAEA